MHISNLQNSKYMKAADIREDVEVRIRQLVMELVGREREEKPVLYFVGRQTGMVCNLTNLNKIARILGSDETNDWIGQDIFLTTELVTFQGQTAPAIRVRAPVSPERATLHARLAGQKPETRSTRDDLSDEIPF
jgi:hypothetical protein